MSNKSPSFLPSLWSDNPFTDFRKEMDQALQSFFGNRDQPSLFQEGFPMAGSFRAPSIDVSENEAAITMTAELPGLAEEDVDLSIHGGVLTLKGEKKMERKDERDNYHIVERRYGSFQRSMRLPDSVDENAVSAKFDKGVLTVEMPKKQGSLPVERKIPIGK